MLKILSEVNNSLLRENETVSEANKFHGALEQLRCMKMQSESQMTACRTL